MDLFIFKDGRVLTAAAGEPIDVPLVDLAVCVTNPQEGQVLTYNGTMWVNAALPEPEETEPEAEPAQEGGGGE